MTPRPEIVVTCQTHGEIARIPSSWTPLRVTQELQTQCGGQECCRTAAITLVNAVLTASDKDLVAARDEISQLRAEIEQVRASSARQEADLIRVRDDLRRDLEGARQVLIRTLSPFKPVYTNQNLTEVAGLAQKLVTSLVEEQDAKNNAAANASEQLTTIRRMLQEALQPFEGVNTEADNMTLAALAAQRINLLVRDLARLEGNARVQDAALQELAEPRRRVVMSAGDAEANRRYDVVDAFNLDIYEGNAVVRLLNTDCPREERIRHVERAAFYVGRLLRRLKSEAPAG